MSLAMQVELYNYFMWVNYQIFKKKKAKWKRTYIISGAADSRSLRDTFSSSSIFRTSPLIDRKNKTDDNASPYAQRPL